MLLWTVACSADDTRREEFPTLCCCQCVKHSHTTHDVKLQMTTYSLAFLYMYYIADELVDKNYTVLQEVLQHAGYISIRDPTRMKKFFSFLQPNEFMSIANRKCEGGRCHGCPPIPRLHLESSTK
jgi:hypothetical protein